MSTQPQPSGHETSGSGSLAVMLWGIGISVAGLIMLILSLEIDGILFNSSLTKSDVYQMGMLLVGVTTLSNAVLIGGFIVAYLAWRRREPRPETP